jgi:hypothetical protein
MAAGSIIVDLLMRTGSFSTDTDRAGKQLQKLKKEAIQFGKDAGVAIGAFATAVGFMVKSTVDAGGEITRLAALINTSTTDFQKLAAGASMVGIEQEKMADIFKDTQDKVGDFLQTGGGPLADFFEKIAPQVGVTAEQFRKLSGPEAMQLYFDSLEKANLSQSEMIFFMEAIASDASLLIPLLAEGGKGFAEMGDQAQRLGAILSEDTLAASEQFRQSMAQLDLIRQAFTRQLTAALLPALQGLVNQFGNTSNAAQGVGQAVTVAATGMKLLLSVGALVGSAFKTLGETIGGLGAALVALFTGRFREAFEIGKNVAFDFVGNLKGAANTVGAIWDDSTKNITAKAPKLGANIASPVTTAEKIVKDSGGRIKQSVDNTYAEIEKQIGNIRREIALFGQDETTVKLFDLQAAGATPDQLGRAAGALGELEGLKQRQEADQKAADARERLAQEGAAVYDSTRTALEKLNVEEARLLDLYNNKAISWDTYTRAVFAANDALMEVKDTESELNDIANELGLTFTSAFEDAVVKGEKLSDVLRGLAQDILRITTRKLVTEPLGNLFSGLAKSALGSIGGSFFGGAKAGGGDVIAGRSFLVGENGPERFIPRTSGTILPNSTTMNRGGDTNINIQIPVSAPKDRATALQFGRDVSRQLSLAQSRNG